MSGTIITISDSDISAIVQQILSTAPALLPSNPTNEYASNMTVKTLIQLAIQQYDEMANERGRYDQINQNLGQYFAVLKWFNKIYKDVVRECRTHRPASYYAINTVASQREYNLPDGFGSVRRIQLYESGSFTKLDQIYETRIDDNGQSQPQEYYMLPDAIGLNPAPDGVYQLRVTYFDIPVTELTLTDTPSYLRNDFHYVLADGLTLKMFETDKTQVNANCVNIWKNNFENGKYEIKNYYSSGHNNDINPAI